VSHKWRRICIRAPNTVRDYVPTLSNDALRAWLWATPPGRQPAVRPTKIGAAVKTRILPIYPQVTSPPAARGPSPARRILVHDRPTRSAAPLPQAPASTRSGAR
jgi:hypothetical protein